MALFEHHIYGYKKGIRQLVLHTFQVGELKLIQKKLENNKIAFHVVLVSAGKANVFFGDSRCVEVVKQFSSPNLSHLTDEEDFILGAMLGYSIENQCERFLRRREQKSEYINDGERMKLGGYFDVEEEEVNVA